MTEGLRYTSRIRLTRHVKIGNACLGTEGVPGVLVSGPIDRRKGSVVELDTAQCRWLVDGRWAEWVEPPQVKRQEKAVETTPQRWQVARGDAVARPRNGLCGRQIFHADGTIGACAQKPGHLDKCRSREQLDAKTRARQRRRRG